MILDPRPYFDVISKMIGIEWMNMSRALAYQIPIHQIDSKHEMLYDKAYAALLYWYRKYGQNATISILKIALQDVSRQDIIQRIGMIIII